MDSNLDTTFIKTLSNKNKAKILQELINDPDIWIGNITILC